MKRDLAGLVVAGVLGWFLAGEAIAQRGRGGGRGGPGPGRGIGGAPHPGPGRIGGGPEAGPRSAGAGEKRPAGTALFDRAGDRAPHPAVANHNIHNWNNLARHPFTPAWYAAHPNAWRWTHPYADLWVAATAVGLASWLSVPYVPTGTSTVIYEGPTTVVNEESGQATIPPEQPPTETADNVNRDAFALAKRGQTDVPKDAEWMPLGVFSLRPTGQQDSTRVIQLAVSREGIVRGSQFDTLTEDTANVQGAVDKKSLRIAWTIGSKTGAAFEAALGDLTRPQSSVTVHFPDGKSTAWEMVTIEK